MVNVKLPDMVLVPVAPEYVALISGVPLMVTYVLLPSVLDCQIVELLPVKLIRPLVPKVTVV